MAETVKNRKLAKLKDKFITDAPLRRKYGRKDIWKVLEDAAAQADFFKNDIARGPEEFGTEALYRPLGPEIARRIRELKTKY